MKKITILIFTLILTTGIRAQTDRYTFAIRLGWAKPSFVNFGNTGEWISKGIGNELNLIGIGYKNIYLNLNYKYFNGLKSDKEMIFGDYLFPTSTDYRNVHMNLTASYEYEIIKRLFIEPQLGRIRSYITSNVVDENENEIEIEKANGLIIGSNLTKYFKMYDKFYLGIYANLNYNMINYTKIGSDLGGNTLGYGFGILIKGTN